MKIISFMNLKGGTGKTASVITLGHILSTMDKKVLLIDNDPQANLTSLLQDETNPLDNYMSLLKGQIVNDQNTITELYENDKKCIKECIRKSAYKNLDYIPSNLILSKAEELLKADVTTPQQYKLKNHLNKIKNNYDYIIIDCSPALSILNINALVSSDLVYIPTRTDEGSLDGVAMTFDLVENVKQYCMTLHVGGIFFTAYNEREKASITAQNLLNMSLAKYLLPFNIGVATMIKRIGTDKKMLLEQDKNHKVTHAYVDFAKMIIGMEEE